jgi:hemolysin III
VAAAIYAFSFTMLFVFSMLYHAVQNPIAKRMLKVCDHISIYFLIAGTYNPLSSFISSMVSVSPFFPSCGVLRQLVSVFQDFSAGKYKLLSTLLYIAMGWILIVGGKTFFTTVPLT